MEIVESGTTVKGIWKKKNSPFYIKGLITIPYGEKLIIEPGVEVRLQSRPYNRNTADYNQGQGVILCKGELEAIGTPENEILFTRNADSGYWGNIIIDGTNLFKNANPHQGNFRFCRIEYGSSEGIEFKDKKYNCYGALSFVGNLANGHISNCIVQKNKKNAILCINSYPEIRGSHILENEGGGIGCTSSGIFGMVEKPLNLEGNIIVRNNGGIQYANAKVSIVNCTIVHNFYCGISFSDHGGIPIIKNTILWGNERSFMVKSIERLRPIKRQMTYSFINHNELGYNVEIDGSNISGGNPGFVDSDNGNYNLKLDSICIGKGENGENIGALDPGFKELYKNTPLDEPNPVEPLPSPSDTIQPTNIEADCKHYIKINKVKYSLKIVESYFRNKKMKEEETDTLTLLARLAKCEAMQMQGRISLADYKVWHAQITYSATELCQKVNK